MRQPRTLNIQVGKKLSGKSKSDIMKEIVLQMPLWPIVAVQIGFEVVRVTFKDDLSFQAAKLESGMYIFGMWCKILGGGPQSTLVHLFDFPFEESDKDIEAAFGSFGAVKNVKKQTYLDSTIYTGTRLVHIIVEHTLPRMLEISGYICRIWYKGQPLVCNLCARQGHKAVNCPNKDKCRRCGESGHFARSCPQPWGNSVPVPAVSASDLVHFPALGASSARGPRGARQGPPDPPSQPSDPVSVPGSSNAGQDPSAGEQAVAATLLEVSPGSSSLNLAVSLVEFDSVLDQIVDEEMDSQGSSPPISLIREVVSVDQTSPSLDSSESVVSGTDGAIGGQSCTPVVTPSVSPASQVSDDGQVVNSPLELPLADVTMVVSEDSSSQSILRDSDGFIVPSPPSERLSRSSVREGNSRFKSRSPPRGGRRCVSLSPAGKGRHRLPPTVRSVPSRKV